MHRTLSTNISVFFSFFYYLSPLLAEKFKLIFKTLNIKEGHIFLAVLKSIFKRLNRHIDILTFVF